MDLNQHLSEHFKLSEFLHPGAEKELTPSILENLKDLAEKLEAVRKTVGGKPIHINSGFRTAAHNKAVGGVKDSYHRLGMAADIVVTGVGPRVVQALLKDWKGGLGSYAHFTHLDIRPARERWNG